jgi:gluconate 2-dehydrogenase gamma chain
MSDDQPRVISRRDLLKRAGAAGAASIAGPAAVFASTTAEPIATPAAAPPQAPAQPVSGQTTGAARRGALESLTAADADLLDALIDRLIPHDEHGPGAREAGVLHYIDRALGGALASSRPAYVAGLAALDRYAQSSRGTRFLDLSNTDKDSVLIDVETGAATGFSGSPAQFFAMVLNHTRQGMFGDPYYGGNVNFAGWDLLGYPGVRTMVTAADQQAYEAGQLKPNHRSAYDYDTFNKATAKNHDPHGDHTHGDQA